MDEQTPLWKQSADWLCRMEVLPSNHRIMWPDASVQDLAYTLRDGVVLCLVATALDPCSLDMKNVNLRPQMAQFLCLKNIKVFLKSCHQFFQLKETDLFQPSMLYGYTDFVRVLHTLSKLSNCSKVRALRPGFQGFPTISTTRVAEEEEETLQPDERQIYNTLEEVTNDDKYQEFYYKHHGGSAYGYGRSSEPSGTSFYTTVDQEEVIYEDLCSFKGAANAKTARAAAAAAAAKTKRDYCIKELVETEANYVDVLNMLRKCFIRPINSIRDQDKKIVFANVLELGEIHTTFYSELLDGRKSIGDVFVDFKLRFLIYGDFCSALPVAQQTLDNLCHKNAAIADEVRHCERNANGGRFRLRDLLAVPMQRVLKYHLLLKELLTHTSPTRQEFASVERAHEAMVDVSGYINEVKRDSEQLHIIREIQNSITDWNLPAGVELREHGGRLRKDAELKVQCHDSSCGNPNKTKVRYVFVFDHVMVMCKPSSSGKAAGGGDTTYAYKDSLRLEDYAVQDVAVLTPDGTTGRRWSHSFMLVHVQSLNAYTLFTRTLDDKVKWMEAINQAIGNVLPGGQRSGHHLVLSTFGKGTTCGHCNKLLKGIFYQGYSCTICSAVLHRKCIQLVSRCGSELPAVAVLQQPKQRQQQTPALPPRPSSATLDDNFNNRTPDYVNTRVEEHSWFVGEMDRCRANARLAEYPVCTFLVRCRTSAGYALSLKTDRDVKHMKICDDNGADVRYFLSDARKFRSIVELVAWYSRNSLKESFSGLDTVLRFPVGELLLMEAQYEFAPAASDKNMLALSPGDRLVLLDKVTGDSQGWWKACRDNRIGYIPKDFVKMVEHDNNDDREFSTASD